MSASPIQCRFAASGLPSSRKTDVLIASSAAIEAVSVPAAPAARLNLSVAASDSSGTADLATQVRWLSQPTIQSLNSRYTGTAGSAANASPPASTSMAAATVARYSASERELHAPGQARHAGGQLTHLFLRRFLGLAHRRIEGGRHQVFEHVLVVAQQAGVDGDALD